MGTYFERIKDKLYVVDLDKIKDLFAIPPPRLGPPSKPDYYSLNSAYATTSTTNTNWSLISGVLPPGQGQSPKPKAKDVPDQYPHTLRIWNNEEDEGQEDYQEDLEWEVEHDPMCKVEEMNGYSFHVCPVGDQITDVGLDSLSDEEGNELDWRTLEPGEYPIEVWATGPDYNGEYDGGLRLK
jgi:hypothetical protein